MAIQQTLVGMERAFKHRAVVLSREISRDDTWGADESSWLQVAPPFPIEQFRVYNRASKEQRIPNEGIETVIQNNLGGSLPDNVEITRNVAIGAMYRDDLPVSSPVYANQYIVVSLEGEIDLPFFPRDAEVTVEMYFGLLANGGRWRVADTWYHHTFVSNAGPVRKKRIRRQIARLLTTDSGGGSPGERVRNGLRGVFNRDGIRNWYVIPGDGRPNSDDDDVVVRHDASFFFVE